MAKLLSIIKKDLKLLIRSRGSASIIVLGPLLVILLVGLGFNTANAYRINIAVYSDSYSSLADSLIEKLIADKFTVEKTSSQDDCISSVKNGIHHICMILPAGLSIDSQESKAIIYHVDYSRINLVYAILDSLSSQIETKSSEISLQLTQSLLDIVSQTEYEIVAKRNVLGTVLINNEILAAKLDLISSKVAAFSPAVDAGLSSSFDNLTKMIDSTNLSSSKKEDAKDTLQEIETDISNIQTQISQSKTDIENEITSAKSIISNAKTDISSLDASLNLISGKISSVGIKSAEKIVSPITTEIKPITASSTYLNYTFPTLIILILSFVSIILASTLVINEKTSNAFFRNAITPSSDTLFMLSNYLTPLIIVFIQLATILAISIIFFKGAFLSSLLPIISIIFISSSLFILIGMLLGNLFKSGETATIASISFLSLLIFFSNIILPIESLPGIFGQLANLNPIVVSETILRRVILFSSGFANIYKGLVILASYILIAMILLFMQHNFIKQSYKLKRIIHR